MNIPLFEMVNRSGWVARIIVLLLVVCSVAAWAIIIDRLMYLRKLKNLNSSFRQQFDAMNSFTLLETMDKKYENASLGRLGKICVTEFRRIVTDANAHTAVRDWSFYFQNQFSIVSDKLSTVVSAFVSKLDRGLIILAIISSAAPFLGLLGTVWGIMNSFFEIGNQGSASLPVVAPGIAEALVTTMMGLFVAIPAVIFYNYFVHRTEKVEDEMDAFSDYLVLTLKKELFNMLYLEKSNSAS